MSAAVLGGELSLNEMSLLVGILQKPEFLSRGGRALRDYIKRIRERKELAAGETDLRELASRLRERKGYEG